MTNSDNTGWEPMCAADDIPPGHRKEVEMSDGTMVLIVHTDNGLFACCADCPHQDTPLCEGHVDGTLLTCTLHFWQWDLRDGKPLGAAELPLPIFKTKIESGLIHVRSGD